jgi:hypothetical protein
MRARKYFDGYNIVYIYAGLGEKDKAFEWLNRGYEERACCLILLKTDQMLKSLRSDPRYNELLKKMGWEK